MMKECIKCRTKEEESGIAFWKRTRKCMDAPFFCKECLRVNRIFEIVEEKKQRNIREQWKHDQKFGFAHPYSHFKDLPIVVEQKIAKANEMSKKYRIRSQKFKAHPLYKETIRVGNANRRARKSNAIVIIDKFEKRKIREFYKNTPEGYHVDHIIPLSKGGKHIMNNLQYLPGPENCSKGSKIKKDIIKRLAMGESISIQWLQRFFKLSFEDAQQIIQAF